MALEKVFQTRVRKYLKTLPNTWFFKASERSLGGIPDFILCVNGIFVALELKRDSKAKTSKLQGYTIERINEAGGLAVVTSPENWAKVFGVLKTLSEGGKYDRTILGSNTRP